MSHYICKKIRNYFNKHTTMLEIAILRNEKERVLTGLTKKNDLGPNIMVFQNRLYKGRDKFYKEVKNI